MSLSQREISRVCRLVNRGSKLLVKRDSAGRQKLKIPRGPFGVFTERYECSDEDLQIIRQKLSIKTKKGPALA
jgi:hypothetical protein